MKKLLFPLIVILLVSGVAVAKDKKHKKDKAQTADTVSHKGSNTSETIASTMKADDMAFDELSHDFGNITDDQDATCQFTFTNKGNEPMIIQKAQPSCGCTVPTYSKEPVLPGKRGTIDVAYHTKGKPAGGFQKTITVVSNAGTKVLTIKGVMEKAPANSVPENTSMLKTN